MSVIDGTTLDLGGPMVYVRVVDGHGDNFHKEAAPSTVAPRRRRRPPSLPEQERRKASLRPFIETEQRLKAAGQWR